MLKALTFSALLIGAVSTLCAQTTTATAPQKLGPGVGLYASGTETGMGLHLIKDSRWSMEARFARTNIFVQSETGSWVTEASLLYRVAYHEKVRCHIGIGPKADFQVSESLSDRYGLSFPIGVEAFPFPFQNAGLFFEAAPFYLTAGGDEINYGIRTSSGFVFYFVRQDKTK